MGIDIHGWFFLSATIDSTPFSYMLNLFLSRTGMFWTENMGSGCDYGLYVISQWCEQLVKVWLSTESQLKFSYVRISAGRRYVHEIAIKSFMKGKSTNFQCKLDCPKNNLTLCLETKPTLQYYTGLSDETVWFGKHTVASALSRQARFVSEIQIFLQLHGLLSFPK